jgi:hypothetical protein
MMTRFACLAACLVVCALAEPWPLADVESGAAARLKGLASVMDGSKRCPFGTYARLHPSHHPLAAHITDGAGNP